MAADMANTDRRVPSRSRPNVAHAASLSRMARRRRPKRLRRMKHTMAKQMTNSTVARIICAVGVMMLYPNSLTVATSTDPARRC